MDSEELQMIPISMNFIIYEMIELSRIYDEIIYSWCFNFIEGLDSMSSASIDVFDIKTWRAC